jgi:hypothetical protein
MRLRKKGLKKGSDPLRRSGVTLLEVLVAIFVMGIGLIALLTLFPIGVLRMAYAIQQEKCSEAGYSATALAVMQNVRNDAGIRVPLDAFKNPQNPVNPALPGASDAIPDGPSYPVLIDPIGSLTTKGLFAEYTVGQGGSFVARRPASFAPNRLEALRWLTLQDDIDFEDAIAGNGPPGTPRLLLPPPYPPNAKVFIRDTRYSYAFLCQRPRYADASVVDMAVVVYNKRSLGMTGALTLPEYVYNSAFNLANNTVTVNYAGNTPPPVRPGDWVLDASPITTDGKVFNPKTNQVVTAHGYFYRVVAVNDLGGNLAEFELETPLRGTFPVDGAGNNVGTIIVLEGVAEVFTKGTARLP